MKTSEIIDCLEGRELWTVFGKKYQEALSRMRHRNDGALTSSDIGLKFDKTIVLETEHIKTMAKLSAKDLWTFANLVALCGFEPSSNEIEEYLSTMCEHASDT